MDKSSNSTLEFRLPSELHEKFKLACSVSRVNPSSVLRSLVQDFIMDNEKDILEKTPITSSLNLNSLVDEWFTIGEMYCGPGGIGLAAKNSSITFGKKSFKFKHSWATDYDADSCMTYKNNILDNDDECLVIPEDIKDLNLKDLPKVDGFLYGFPCNDFSNVGETKGLKGLFGPLYSYGVEYINYANPKFIFAENVSGISNANSGYAFKKILSELSGAGDHGYELTANFYKFEEYGVPQSRHRYIIVGFRKDLGLKFEVPAPSMQTITCKEALENPPIPASSLNQERTKQSETVIERLEHTKPGENAWTADLPDRLRLNVKGAKLSMIYKRLDPSKPSYTITGSGGGGTHVYHYKEPRALTNRERARLQTFPDDFHFFGSKESVRKQIGMAVPVKGVQIILESILKTLVGKNYDSIEPNVDILKIRS
jgi:DNA (cytosine-5)-methyltransferase 1